MSVLRYNFPVGNRNTSGRVCNNHAPYGLAYTLHSLALMSRQVRSNPVGNAVFQSWPHAEPGTHPTDTGSCIFTHRICRTRMKNLAASAHLEPHSFLPEFGFVYPLVLLSHSNNTNASLIDIKTAYRKTQCIEPAPHFFRSVAPRIFGIVPVEVYMVVFV